MASGALRTGVAGPSGTPYKKIARVPPSGAVADPGDDTTNSTNTPTLRSSECRHFIKDFARGNPYVSRAELWSDTVSLPPLPLGLGWHRRPIVRSAVGPRGTGQGCSACEIFARGPPPRPWLPLVYILTFLL